MRQGAGLALAAQAAGAQVREARAILEAEHQMAQAAPAGHGRAAAGVGDVGLEAAALGANAADRAGAEIDHQVELGVAVGGSCSDNGVVIGIAGHRLEGFVMTEEDEA